MDSDRVVDETVTGGGLKTSGRFSSIEREEKPFGNINTPFYFKFTSSSVEKEDDKFHIDESCDVINPYIVLTRDMGAAHFHLFDSAFAPEIITHLRPKYF